MHDDNPTVGTCAVCGRAVHACDDIYRLGSERDAPIVHDDCLVPLDGWEVYAQLLREAREEEGNARYEAWKQDGVLV